jgi:hypothetical protein
MNLLKKEPAAAAGVAAVLAVALVYRWVTPEQAVAWEALAMLVVVPIAQALWTRSRVFSPNTIQQAGLNPEEVQRRADDPAVQPYREPFGLK